MPVLKVRLCISFGSTPAAEPTAEIRQTKTPACLFPYLNLYLGESYFFVAYPL